MDVDVPAIDPVITWAQELRGEELIENGKLLINSPDLSQRFVSEIPHYYGYHTIDDVFL